MSSTPSPKRIAVVGSGCAGLGALWALNTSTSHDVHLFEADESLGGHTNTVKYRIGEKEVDVDTGFIVYNTATYPNLIRFLDTLGVKTMDTEMSFGVSRDKGVFEWAGNSLGSIFAQWSNIPSPRMWRMLFDVVRFNQYALDLLRTEEEGEESSTGVNGVDRKAQKPIKQESIGEYLEKEGYSEAFRDDYLIPLTAAIWSTSPEKCSLEFPAVTLVRFMWNHHLLRTITARPSWRTIPGGSKQYIDAVMRDFPQDKVHLNQPVTGVEDINGKIILQFEDDEDLFDHVILACHGDQAYSIVEEGGTEEERSILACFQSNENIAYLHSDNSLMPKRKSTWSSWNLLTSTTNSALASLDPTAVCLTYNMNILQHIPTSTYGDVLVTLNPITLPDPSTIQGRWSYQHPLYTTSAIRAQKQLPRIQNTRGISYAGAWTRYGFHEDGFSSGLAVAVDHLDAELPWEFVDSTFSRGRWPRLGVADYVARLMIWYINWGIWGVEPTRKVVTAPLALLRGAFRWWGKGKVE